MPLPAIIGAAAGIGGALLSSSAQKKAAKTAAATAQNTTNANNALTLDIYNRNTANMTPFMQRGDAAGNALNGMLLGQPGTGPVPNAGWDQFFNSSGARATLDEGQRAVNVNYAAKGALQSGAAQRALQDRGQQQLLNNYLLPYMGLLQGQQNTGMGAASAVAGVGQNMVSNVTANNNAASSATANAALLAGQANANLYGGIANSLGTFAGTLGSSYFK